MIEGIFILFNVSVLPVKLEINKSGLKKVWNKEQVRKGGLPRWSLLRPGHGRPPAAVNRPSRLVLYSRLVLVLDLFFVPDSYCGHFVFG
jgi:hypothetical protein